MWWFCVDYHAVNTVIIKDRFSIPAAEELFDEIATHKFSPSLISAMGITKSEFTYLIWRKPPFGPMRVITNPRLYPSGCQMPRQFFKP